MHDVKKVEERTRSPHSRHFGRWVAILTGLILGMYLGLTPPGLLTKFDMVGYAVCHRIPSHSFFFGDVQLPLCARCSGTFLGALVGLFGQAIVLHRRRATGFPPTPILLLLIGFIGLMGVDGFNSYMTMLTGTPLFYEPQQLLRVTTGALNGLALSSLIYPVFNFSLWEYASPQPAIRNLADVGVLVLLEAGVVLLVLTGWFPLLYPLALLSAAGVLTMLTLVNSSLVMMVFGWENSYNRIREAVVPILLGFVLALIQVGGIDLLRYWWTGTLEGFPGLS